MHLQKKTGYIFFPFFRSCIKFREWSFFILGTGAKDFWQGHETFVLYYVGVRIS